MAGGIYTDFLLFLETVREGFMRPGCMYSIAAAAEQEGNDVF